MKIFLHTKLTPRKFESDMMTPPQEVETDFD